MLDYFARFLSVSAVFFSKLTSSKGLSVTAQSILDTNHAQRSVGPDLGTNCFQKVSTDEKGRN